MNRREKNEKARDNDLMKEASEAIEGLENDVSQREVDEIRNEDPMKGLRNSLAEFINNRLQSVAKEDRFRELIKEAILRKVENDEVSIQQLTDLLKTVDRDTNVAVETIFNLLRPDSHGGVSPLLGSGGGSEGESYPGDMALNQEQSEAVNKLWRLTQAMEMKMKEMDGQNNTPESSEEDAPGE